jgi:hypothetical protein
MLTHDIHAELLYAQISLDYLYDEFHYHMTYPADWIQYIHGNRRIV